MFLIYIYCCLFLAASIQFSKQYLVIMRKLLQKRPTTISLIQQDQSDIEDESRQGHPPKSNSLTLYDFKLLRRRRHYKKATKVQINEQQCSICLSQLRIPIGKLPCKHQFCLACIRKSAQFSNKCPYCRSEYHFIQSGQAMIEVNAPIEAVEEDEDEPCYMCGRNDDFDRLLECDFCEYAYCHSYCDQRIRGNNIPAGEWFCHSCEELIRENGL